jgi:hypothetical protein
MDISQQRHPANTQEFMAVWNAAKEEHLVQQLVPLLPLLGETAEAAAHHLVHALYVASTAEGGVTAAMDYLAKVAEDKGSGT